MHPARTTPKLAAIPAVFAVAVAACSGDRAKPTPIRFLHTFSAAETELFNATMAERGLVVDSSIVPFARGQQVISEILRAGTSCPDLIRIDSTWLLALEPSLTPVPADLQQADWLPEAVALAGGGAPPSAPSLGAGGASAVRAAVPQTVDGLFVVRDARLDAPRSPTVADLVVAARAARSDRRPYPLGLRVDGYWLVPWLRANGADLAIESPGSAGARSDAQRRGESIESPGSAGARSDAQRRGESIDADGAPVALAEFAALFRDVAPPPPPAGSEAPDELRRWNAHEVAYWVTGPWQVGELADRGRVAISALDHAPRGGQLLVVPKCAKHPTEGWQLAGELTSVSVQTKFADAFATVPTRAAALAAAPPLVRAMHDALERAEALQRTVVTPLLFDDLNPALAAVVAHDATPDEAIAGVRRAWHRLARTSASADRPSDGRSSDGRSSDGRGSDGRR